MKIKIAQPGYETFTGNFGGVEFVDAVSVRDVTPREAARIANIVRTESIEDGSNPSASQAALDSHSKPMEVRPEEAKAPAPQKYSEAELEAIASKEGIKGLRKISDPLGVKSNGIADLIALILKAQAPAEAVQFLGEVPSDVVKADEAPAAPTEAPEAAE